MTGKRGILLALVGSLAAATATFARVPGNDRSPAPAPEEVRRYLYVAVPGMSNYLQFGGHGLLVYDIEDGHSFVKRIPTRGFKYTDGTPSNVKGITASAATNSIYISHLETMQRVDLRTETVVWDRPYPGGADRMAISPDGRTIYLPNFPRNQAYRMMEFYHVVDAETGDILESIWPEISGTHNTIFAPDGQEVYMAGLRWPYLAVADANTRQVVRRVGPFSAPIRPFTINSDQTLVYVNVNELLGFEIGDLKSGKVLYRIDAEDEGFDAKLDEPKFHGNRNASHGIGMTPDETEVWFVDEGNSLLHVYDNTLMPPRYKESIQLESEPHWITFGIDGKYAYPSTGEVIDVRTRKVVAKLRDENGAFVKSEKMLEVHVTPEGRIVKVGDQFGIGRKRELQRR